jgi:hypothetical protein
VDYRSGAVWMSFDDLGLGDDFVSFIGERLSAAVSHEGVEGLW